VQASFDATTVGLDGGRQPLERMVSGRTKAHELKRVLSWTWKAEQLATVVNT
jgi:hypothetical protein